MLASLTAGATRASCLAFTSTAAQADTTLGLEAALKSQAPDPVEGNDSAQAALEVLLPPQADLSLSIDGPATLPRRAFRAEYAFTLANGGTIAAAQPTLVIEGTTMTATASVQAPAGWQCSKQYNGSQRSATLTTTAASLAAGASADFAVRVNTRPTPGPEERRVGKECGSTGRTRG